MKLNESILELAFSLSEMEKSQNGLDLKSGAKNM